MSFVYPTVTISAAPYNVYEDVASATTYFGTVPGSTWSTYSSTQQAQGLLQATRFIDRQHWAGAKTDSTNALAFPRTGLTDVDGNAVDSSTLPPQLPYATAELALAILVDPSILSNAYGTASNVKMLKGGPAEVEFFRPQLGSRLPTIVNDWLAPFFGAATGNRGSYQTGEDGCSSFDSDDLLEVWREP